MELDPRLTLLRRALEQRPAQRLPRGPEPLEAAVSLILRPHNELELLLIERARHEADPWSGHVALPGGRRKPDDPDLIATAFRETTEETGIPLSRLGTLLGRLDEVRPTTPRVPPIIIAPFVVAVPPDTEARPEPREVNAALWVPLDALRAEGAASEILIELENGSRAFPSLRYGGYTVWGLTYRILKQLFELADACGL